MIIKVFISPYHYTFSVNKTLELEEPKLLPGDLAIWFFIFMELLVFAIAFIAYAITRAQNLELFNEFQLTLNKEFGAINTILLITSSYFVIRAVHAIKLDKVKSCITNFNISLLFGAGFLLLKSLEYYDKFSAGITLSTNTFYMFYLSLTMFHFLHVILGMIILFAVVFKAKRGHYSAADHFGVESGASYWHMVDLVWIILFPLVYIIR